MANVTIVNVDGTHYDLKDSVARKGVEDLEVDIKTLLRTGYYNKEQIDYLLKRLSITGSSDIYTRKEVDTLLESKLDSDDLCLSEDLTVQLGEGGSVGSYKTGDVIVAGTSIKQIIPNLLAKQVPPTYVQPTISIANNSGTASGNYEIGTTITPKLKATFTQNDAGDLTSIVFKKSSAIVGEEGTTSPHTLVDSSFTLESSVSYTATAKYEQGAVKNDNLGNPYPTGQISAGSKTSSKYTFNPYRQGYFYGVLDTDSSVALTSDIIRKGSKKNSAYSSGNLPTIKASTVANRKRVFVACPATNKGVTKVVMPSAMNADCTADFVKQSTTVVVKGANDYTGIAYNVWVYEPASISDDQTFLVTLG